MGTASKIVSVPLTFLRDYTCPMAQQESWDRNRAAIVPMTIVMATMYLVGIDDQDTYIMGLYATIPGALIGLAIRLKTKKS
jgi:hypothetical protein